mgnify:CR=1 FL=1
MVLLLDAAEETPLRSWGFWIPRLSHLFTEMGFEVQHTLTAGATEVDVVRLLHFIPIFGLDASVLSVDVGAECHQGGGLKLA